MRNPLKLLPLIALLSSSTAFAVTPPYAEDFETEPTCGTGCGTACVLTTSAWTNSITDDLDWTVDVGGTTSGSTGPGVDHAPGNATGNYLYIESSAPCNNAAQEAHLVSPPLELAGLTAPQVSFWYHMFGATQGTLHVDVLDATQALLLADIIPSVTDNQDLWQQSANIDLTAYVGQTVHIRIRGIVGTSFTSDMAVDDFSFVDANVPDVGVASIDAPLLNACGLGAAEQIMVTVSNFSGVAAANFPISYTLDGTTVNETFAGTLAAGASATYTFAATGDFSALGAHTATVTTGLVGDADPTNDSVVDNFFNGRLISTYPANEDFEGATAAEWISGGTNSSWQLGTPANAVIQGTNSGVNAWATNLTGLYNANENSFVRSTSCYDFTGVTAPTLSMAIWWESEFSWDGANVQYSIDGGQNWVTIGAVGDPVNWYTDNTINGVPGGDGLGWTGRDGTGSPGWVVAIHEVSVLANEPSVNFRINFGSDGSVNDEGVAIDDFSLFEITPSIEVTQVGPPPAIGAILPGTTVVTQILDAVGFGGGTREIASVNLTNSGTVRDVDITLISIYADDGDGIFNASLDALAGTGTFTNGTSNITTTGLTLQNFEQGRVFVALDVALTAVAGSLVGTEIANPAVDIVEAGAAPVIAINVLLGPLFAVGGPGLLPVFDDFSGSVSSRSVAFQAGLAYPTAAVTGTITMVAVSANDALVEILPIQGGLLPTAGTGFGAISFPNGEATGAIDYLLDLSAYDPAVDPVWVGFRFTDTGEEDDPEDNVFVSLDGGLSWFGSLYNFNWNDPQLTWTDQTLDLSGFVSSVGGAFTNNVVVRFQANDNTLITTDGMLLDTVLVGLAQEANVERPINSGIVNGGTDPLGAVAPGPNSYTWIVRNTGDFPLVATPTTSIPNNVTITGVSASTLVAASSTAAVTIDFLPGAGAFTFNLDVLVDDPRIQTGIYTILVSGMAGQPTPEIDVQRPLGTSIATGNTDAQGNVPAGVGQSNTYYVANVGFGDLTVSSAAIANEVNVTAMVPALNQVIGPVQNVSLDVGYQPTAAGAFSFDLVITSDDADEGTYTITIDGTATAADIEIQNGGVAIPNAGTDTQPAADVGTPVMVTYDVVNNGNADLTVTAISLGNQTNVTATITAGAPGVVAGGNRIMVDVTYTASTAGAFSFDLTVDSDDPVDGTYVITVDGQTAGPDIVVERGGNVVASGGNDAVGNVVTAEATTFTYTVRNSGTTTLNVGNVVASNENNATVTVAQPGVTAVAAGATTTFDVEVTATADGAFGFDISVPSDDVDTPDYAYAVGGTAAATPDPDAGIPMKDAGPDGGVGGPDAGTTADTGVVVTPPKPRDEGCGCTAADETNGGQNAASLGLLMLIGLALVRRRR